ncbi:hypothetical protein GYMLUDRAFT_690654 [Collybiopsis luxurians FD-317 M1]|uniref:Myb-like domain-containing protein n=1 Tax=Collybiopsis luxurians FD-317 M1 TaxID=944289 RepID=A0A0D0CK63_9AGAR|nr:hypothetical protein GYMLUDRAFT_690654 [Collybiopsis luxurians FD-317 M1]
MLHIDRITFDNRSPVDLKDRFRTYFPDAYKQHYPNARTHLSTKIRSTLPDGSSLFEKTRSKKRRPFTEEEDRALKAGYEKHGTIWATIVKDPVFQEQNRRSTDLRDRFRNAFPELYQAAGYKPRSAVKKKPTTATASPASNSTTPVFVSGPSTPATSPRRVPIRAATDDQIAMSTTGPVRVQTRRRRRNTSQGLLFRGGTKSVPQSNAPSEDEDSSGGEEDDDVVKPTRTTRSTSNPLSANVAFGWDQQHKPSPSSFSSFSSSPVTSSTTATDDDDVDNAMDTSLGEYGYEFPANAVPNSHGNGNSGDTGHGNHNGGGSGMTMIGKSAWGTQDWFSPNPRLDNSTATGSSSSAYADGGGGGMSPSSPFSPFSSPPSFSLQTLNSLNSDLLFNPMNNHAFNLVPATSGDSNEHNGHGVFDRYDLVPPTASNSYHSFSHSHSHTNSISSSSSYAPYDLSFSSDFGLGDDYDSRSAFSDEWVITGGGLGGESGGLLSSSMSMDGMGGGAVPGGGGRGFTHHSDYAGDLIFSARTHQPVHQPFALGLGLGFGTAAGASGASGSGPSAGIHPLQLHTHTHTHAHQHSHPHTHPHGHNHSHGHTHTHTPVLSALPLIDEIELTGISLEDTIMADPSSSSASSSLEAARAREGMEHDGIMAMDMNMSASLTTTTSTSTSTSSSTASVSGTSPSEMRQTRTQKDGVGNGNGAQTANGIVRYGHDTPQEPGRAAEVAVCHVRV